MKYQLVLQWAPKEIRGLEALAAIGTILKDGLSPTGEMTNRQAGPDALNIFIQTNNPEEAFDKIKENLWMYKCWESVRAAHRDASGNHFTVLWPKGLTEFK